MSHNHKRDYTKYHGDPKPQTQGAPAEVEEVIDNLPTPAVEDVAPAYDDQAVEMPIGVVIDCERLNVRTQPSPMADVICTVKCGEKLAVDKSESHDLFYKVFAEIGAEGYCMKQFIEIES